MIEHFFETDGSPVELEGKNPLVLGGENKVWMVSRGRVDLFAVLKDTEGKAEGSRHYLERIEPGQVFFSLDPKGIYSSLQIIAVGSVGTALLALEITHFMPLAQNPTFSTSAAVLIEEWLKKLSLAVRTKLRPRNAKELETGTEHVVAVGEVYRAADGGLWVSHLAGESRFMGREDIRAIQPGIFVPVFEESWLVVSAAGAVKCVDTLQYLHSDSNWNDIQIFHHLVMECIEANIRHEKQSQEAQLKRRSERDRQGMEDALFQLGAVLSTGEPPPIAKGPIPDPLLSACRMVGRALEIEMKPDPFSNKGEAQLDDPLQGIARASGVRMRKVALRDDWWRKENGPLLAFLQEDRKPVALIPKSPRAYMLWIPGTSQGRTIDSGLAQSLEPMAYSFYRPFPEGAVSAREFLRFGLRGCRSDLTTIVLLGASGALLGLLFPFLTGILMDSIIPEAARGMLFQMIVILLCCTIASAMFEITKKIALLRVETKADISMQAALWDRLMSLPANFFRRFSSGDLAMRSLGINTIRQIISGVTVNTILGSLFSLFNFILLFYYDWELALVAAGLGLVSLAFIGTMSLSKVKHQRKMNEVQGKISGAVLQFITGIAKLRVSGTEGRAFTVWAKMFESQKKSSYKAGLLQGTIETFNATFPVLAAMTIFAWLIFGEVEGLSTGDFVAFNAAYSSFQNALLQMAVALTASLNVVPLYERLTPIIQEPPEVDTARAHPGELTGAIEVNHVDFRYVPGGPLVLNDISLSIRPGEFVALVGPSGSGKSTILRLLLGFESPEYGSIYYDDQDLATMDVREVRRQIGVVLQNAKVMPGDIFKNIVGASSMTVDDAWDAARMAGLDEDIRGMPMGMNTMVSAGGETLSGGQRQRLLIARAVVKKPRILFFDEATSALDNKTQAVVSRCLEGLKATRVIIAHRLSTVLHADRIIVLEGGKIVEMGSYTELMSRNGVFAELAKRQLS